MKMTKKMRKKARGMNHITSQHFESGHEPPTYHNGEKVKRGTPYVNRYNFI